MILGYEYSSINMLVGKFVEGSYKYVGMLNNYQKENQFKVHCEAGTYYAYVRL